MPNLHAAGKCPVESKRPSERTLEPKGQAATCDGPATTRTSRGGRSNSSQHRWNSGSDLALHDEIEHAFWIISASSSHFAVQGGLDGAQRVCKKVNCQRNLPAKFDYHQLFEFYSRSARSSTQTETHGQHDSELGCCSRIHSQHGEWRCLESPSATRNVLQCPQPLLLTRVRAVSADLWIAAALQR
jgi:hypothetical protein